MNGLLSSVTPSASVSTNSILTTGGQAQPSQNFYMPEKDEIWSGILKGVASSKMVPTKNVLILGEPGVGKSTLVHYLKNDPGPQQTPKFDAEDATPFNVSASNNYTHSTQQFNEEKNDLALGYTFVDVKDEENEAIARLGLYKLGLSSPEFLPLLKFAIRSESISNSCVLILIDWTRPWKFLETLERWIHVLHHLINEICKEGMAAETTWTKGKAVVDELREKLELYLQTYTEPANNKGLPLTASTSSSSIPPNTTPAASTTTTNSFVSTPTTVNTSSSLAADQVVLPLSRGCLTNNLGIPITIVCCKSDALNTLEQTHDFKDDQFDFIQQTLRCICMKYGAALFYTSTLHPHTYHHLREYILHRVLTTPTKSYPFHIKAQVIERDTVFVPSGWDSWGKIKVLREGFDCESVSDGWDADMDALGDRQSPGTSGARGAYEESIPNGDSEVQPQHIPVTTICEDEQSFFERHFETLQKAHETSGRPSTGTEQPAKPGTTDPSRLSSNALDMMRISIAKNNERQVGRSKRVPSPDKNRSVNSTSSNVPTNAGSTTPSFPPGFINNMPPGQTGPSNEIIADFFNKLLYKNSSGNASPTGSASPGASFMNGLGRQPNGRSEDPTPSYRRPAVPRKEVARETDRIK
ncbi:dynein light intermediate chain-domain-containing protein [Mucor mucedo]|uniref:dynein light intermediate chain-domain-containing protein n=1 Tax=Mucor mucedo TaxID=29922 RepID=UPI00221F8C95|nr:dynein light intermediate chain-domain-containing protein [Mucor mucedo]KAI7876776.1 dynein light intermediate chain-domain-containing protein [Mucor mucedo]